MPLSMRENYVVRRWNNVFYWEKSEAHWLDYFEVFRKSDAHPGQRTSALPTGASRLRAPRFGSIVGSYSNHTLQTGYELLRLHQLVAPAVDLSWNGTNL